jgi:hypothetical protein
MKHPLVLGVALGLLVIGGAAAQAPFSAPFSPPPSLAIDVQAGDPAEIAYWNSVKDSRNPAEVQSYIDRFPNGMFVDLARLRLDVLSAGAPGAPTVPPPIVPVSPPVAPPPIAPSPIVPVAPPIAPPPVAPPPAPSSALLNVDLNDPSIVREVQEKLYNLNYQIPIVNGVMGDRTRDAIRRWQTLTRREATGFLTPDQFVALRNTKIPTVWGAVAYTARGASGTSWNFKTRREAENAALTECRRRAGRNANCNVLATFDDACGALAVHATRHGRTTHFGAFAVTRTALSQARTDALKDCSASDKSRNDCKIHIVFCANGAHQS